MSSILRPVLGTKLRIAAVVLFLIEATGIRGNLAVASAGEASDASASAAFALLERMARAIKSTDFEGTFVYQYGDSLAAMRIVHRYQDGESQDSLLTLNGPIRTIGRSDEGVACLLSGGQSVLMARADDDDDETSAPGRPAPNWSQLQLHYRFGLLEPTRVAGRSAEVVDIAPKDGLRYGYRFSIDHETYLPLRTALIDGRGRAVQQLMFTDLDLNPDANPVSTSAEAVGESSRRTAAAGDSAGAARNPGAFSPVPPGNTGAVTRGGDAVVTTTGSPWRFQSLPSGFGLVEHEWLDAGAGAKTEYFMFSDGLASVSVYVERADQPGLVGQTQMATIHAAGKWADGHQITAVGEVPSATVSALIEAIEPAAEGSAEPLGAAALHRSDLAERREVRP